MHRDLRVGLSLSLLVCGFAGAFCFRVDPVAVDAPDPLAEVDDVPAAGPPPEPVRLADDSRDDPKPKRRRPRKPAGPPPPPVPAVSPPPALVAAAPPPEPPAAAVPVEEPPADLPAPRSYTIAPGDTLSGIAERELGSHRRYHDIFEANRDVLASPDAIRVGMTLRMPGDAGPL